MISLICLHIMVLLVWFNTDAFIEYFGWVPFDVFKINAYKVAKTNDVTIEYHAFILYNYNTFLVRLITCPICLNIWLCIISCLLLFNYIDIPIVCVVSLVFYYLLVRLL